MYMTMYIDLGICLFSPHHFLRNCLFCIINGLHEIIFTFLNIPFAVLSQQFCIQTPTSIFRFHCVIMPTVQSDYWKTFIQNNRLCCNLPQNHIQDENSWMSLISGMFHEYGIDLNSFLVISEPQHAGMLSSGWCPYMMQGPHNLRLFFHDSLQACPDRLYKQHWASLSFSESSHNPVCLLGLRFCDFRSVRTKLDWLQKRPWLPRHDNNDGHESIIERKKAN